jgi:cell division protein FtsW
MPVRQPGELRWETRLLAVVAATLVVFGIAMTYGASSLVRTKNGGVVGGSFALTQLTGALLGGILMLTVARLDYRQLRPLAWPLLLATIFFLFIPILPFTHAISPVINGARRWVRLGPLNFQPSEVARLAVIVWCAMLAAKKGEQVRQFKKGVLPFVVVLGVIGILVVAEPNLSMAILITLLGGIVLFSAGAKIGHFLILGFLGLILVYQKIHDAQYRVARLLAFTNPGEAPDAATSQIHQSFVGVGSGGIFGVGFGQGQQKFGYLPYAYSDFIFSAIGEEWGFLGILVIVGLFALFCWLGFRIARTAEDPFGQYLATGLTAGVGVTAFMHMAVTLGLIPTTGLTLPFVSYGRSSLVVTLIGTGILLSVGRMRGKPTRRLGGSAARPIRTRRSQ